ncbi:HAD family hydrolase [Mucilaginibacter agri]|uniref:Haloacid dehalogenase-like hydrolase n=1 Tax=Mucilaginibacter agri TaxID=2695265 RepID=A0A965ZCS5_9SPHI|nr:HAD family hydrolase [Mucilaginibacter agri]NCD67767.1 haloacid dehalogenase-like hydrolase [Mucilaginibacter agri]
MKLQKHSKQVLIAASVAFLGIAALSFNSERKSKAKAIKTEVAGKFADPLPSWNEGPLKEAIIDYVKRVTNSSGKDFIPVEDRIATFDNDGTLWSEQPTIELEYAKVAFKKMIQNNPELATQQPYKAILTKDKAYLAKADETVLMAAIVRSLSGTSQAEFDRSVKAFFDTAHYVIQKTKYPVQDATYQPQLELLKYLRANGFKTYICTGGTIEFVRGISERYYGIPSEQVIGTKLQYRFDEKTRSIMREGKINSICDKAGKPVNIQWHIGKKPVFACGNERSGGDIQMLKFSQSSPYTSFQLLVNHDDAVREAAYKEKDNASLNAAAANKWHVISMKSDWKKIFPVK